MADSRREIDRTVAGSVFCALGVVLAGYTVWQLWVAGPPEIVGLLVGTIPGALLAVLFFVVGVWTARTDLADRYASRLLAWALASGLFGAASAGLFVVYETSRGAIIYEAPLVVANTAAGFALLGVFVGRYDVRARERAARLARYKELVENVPVGIFRSTAGEAGRFVEVNPAMVDIFGADSPRDLLETPVREVYVDPEQRESFSRRLREEGLVIETEIRYRRFDGETFWGAVTAISRAVDGQVFFDGIVEDITERKQYEQTLERHNAQLEVLNDVLRHDVRNDMAVVRAHGERLRERVEASDREAVETLLSKVDHVVELTETARDLATVASGDRIEQLSAVGVSEVLSKEIEATRQSYDDATVVVEGELPAVAVRANEMLSSVFANLLGNAVQHNDTASPTVTVGVDVDEETVTVRVADDGPGIPDEQKADIFQHGEKGTESVGTGLGLYLVETLVDQYGGSVAVSDNEPRGTVFTVELVRAQKPAATSWLE